MKPLAFLLLCALTASAATPSSTPAPKEKTPGPTGSSPDHPTPARKPSYTPAPIPAHQPASTPAPTPASPPTAAAARGLSFEARAVSSGGGQEGDTTSQTSSGQTVKTRLRHSQTTLELLVRNLAREPDTAHFDWFFVARDALTETTFVWDKEERDVKVPAAGQRKETIESLELESATTRTSSGSSSSSASTKETRTGARPYGWIVRMFVGDQLVKVQTSNPSLDRIARDPAQFNQLLQQKPPTPPASQ